MRKESVEPKRKTGALPYVSFFSVVALLAGVALMIISATLNFFKAEENDLWRKVCLYGGAALTVAGALAVVICVILYRRAERREKDNADREEKEGPRLVRRGLPPTGQTESGVVYVNAQETSTIYQYGKRQTLEDKFAQIAQMDRTQFVVYVARLFSHKGYQVKLTPVLENHCIDLIVERSGIAPTAVSCILSNRVLSEEDLKCVRDGMKYYNGVQSCMALTNSFFDRRALTYAQIEHMKLIDRNTLAEDFMN